MKELEIAVSKLRSQLKKENIHDKCFYKNCSSSTITAHSIQNNKILDKISRNGKVKKFDFGPTEDGIKAKVVEEGRGKASTFTGFCNYHDTEIFKPIELYNYEKGNREQEYLFAYRALAKEYHAKKSLLNIFEDFLSLSNKKYLKLRDYCGLSNKIKKEKIDLMFKMQLEGTKDSLELLDGYKKAMNINLNRERYYKIESQTIEFEKEYHIAVSSMFFIEYDMNGKQINDIDKYQNMNPTFLTIIPQNGKTYVIISYFKTDRSYLSFIESQITEKSKEYQKTILSNMIAIYAENVFLSPTKWENLSKEERNNYLELFSDTIINRDDNLLVNPGIDIFI